MTVESVHAVAAKGLELRTAPLAGGDVPILGHGWKLVRDPLSFLAGLREHGDMVRLKLGPKTVYAVTTPALAGRLALSPDFEVGGPLWESLEGLLGRGGVAITNGPTHRRQRRTIQPALRSDAIRKYGPIMEEEAHALAERWRPGEVIDCSVEAFRVSVRIVARCLLGSANMDARTELLCAALATVFRGMYRRMVVPVGPLYRLPLPANRRYNRALADLHRLVDEIIAERRASGQRPDDLLTTLMESKDERGEPISEGELHDQVVAILTPGTETVASTVMWILQVLAEYPEQAERIREEVKVVAGERNVVFDDVRNLTRTNNLIVEAMRLRPAVWILTRRSVAETELGGYRVPAGADIVYSPYAIQRDPRSFGRHLEFDPDRWLPERSREVPKHAMCPFGVGNRKCPSDHFSMAELTLITAAVASRWRFEQAPGSDDTARIGITLRPNQLRLRVVPRSAGPRPSMNRLTPCSDDARGRGVNPCRPYD